MDEYNTVSEVIAKLVTRSYSTSFSLASRLFPKNVQSSIYNIYGLVRCADEIVDTYRGSDAAALLQALEQEVYDAIDRQYSVNPIVHAFQITARSAGIDQTLIRPFFASMATDINTKTFSKRAYANYIYGSAEVIGLMCLHVFCANRANKIDSLSAGAQRLGAAYQKINFLRDLAEDHKTLQRYYFPIGTFETFDDTIKQAIVSEVRQDLAVALSAIQKLPAPVQPGVYMSYRYFKALLDKLALAPATKIKAERIRISNPRKLALTLRANIAVRAGLL